MRWLRMFVQHIFHVVAGLLLAVMAALSLLAFAGSLIFAFSRQAKRFFHGLAARLFGALIFMTLFQGLGWPASIALDGAISWFSALIPPSSGLVPTVTFVLALSIPVFFAGVSLMGFWTGWTIGARAFEGRSIRNAMQASRSLATLAAAAHRMLPFFGSFSLERGLAKAIGIAGVATIGILLAQHIHTEVVGTDEITYRDTQIKLSKKYESYEDYKDDDDNISAAEIGRIEQMMTEAKIGPDFASWNDFVDQAFQINFPGYGMGPGPVVAATDRAFLVEFIEIPKTGKDRYFVLEKLNDGRLRLVDDFVAQHTGWPPYLAISSIRLIDNRLIYVDRDGKTARETTLSSAG